MTLNKNKISSPVFTSEGGRAKRITPYLELQRSVLANLLWENSFYENGEDCAKRISNLISKVPAEKVSELAVIARNQGKLRHIPLLLAVEMAKLPSHKHVVANTLQQIIQRPDELGETLSIYWKNGKRPISNQIKLGLGNALKKFDEYSLSKYNQDKAVKLRDVLFLTHPKPENKKQATLWKKLANNQLAIADRWETRLSESKGENKKEVWEGLLKENKLGALALIRNLRNFKDCGVSDSLIKSSLSNMKVDRVLPYRFITAAKYAPNLENELEQAMFKSIDSKQKINGKTVLLIDCSGSMGKPVSLKSEATRFDCANGLAILAREMFSDVEIYSFSDYLKLIPNRRGFALRDSILNSQPHLNTYMGAALKELNSKVKYERIIVFTDEQSADNIPDPKCENAYMLNISTEKYGVGYGKWTNISGFSESILDYISELEKVAE